MKQFISKHWWTLSVASLLLGYFVTHVYHLTNLPVFADEAIYIRWSQLIIDDWQRYAFFPLNDGKTPLHMWLMVPFQLMFSDQLFAGRFLSVLVGLVQVPVMGILAYKLSGRKKTALLTMILTSVLPFWFMHHRLAVIDALLTFLLSLTFWGVLQLAETEIRVAPNTLKSLPRSFLLIWIFTGLSFGLALWTKLPAVLFIPSFLLFTFITATTLKVYIIRAITIGSSLGLGILFFASMKLHPAFGQLFNRGGDFLYPWSEVVFHGLWQQTLQNTPTYINYFGTYLSWFFLLWIIVGLFLPHRLKRTIHLLFWAALIFAAPIALLGKVVYPRYLFPATLFLTLAGSLSFQAYTDAFITSQQTLTKKIVASLIMILVLANILGSATVFVATTLSDANTTPFVEADKTQLLHEWSSGHGLFETSQLLKQEQQKYSLAVATEGYFGTLPDGLNLYFHGEDVSNLYIEGIGYPIKSIPDSFVTRAQDYDRTWLVVNSHRLELNELEDSDLVIEYCRPDNAPCLQVWDITHLISIE